MPQIVPVLSNYNPGSCGLVNARRDPTFPHLDQRRSSVLFFDFRITDLVEQIV